MDGNSFLDPTGKRNVNLPVTQAKMLNSTAHNKIKSKFPRAQEILKNFGFAKTGDELGWGYCLSSKVGICWNADSAKNEAEDAMKKAFPGLYNATDNQADAFRHAYWSFVMAQSYGYDVARSISDAYERAHPNNDSSAAMDVYNNHIGAALGVSNPAAISLDDRTKIIMNALDQGHLIANTWHVNHD